MKHALMEVCESLATSGLYDIFYLTSGREQTPVTVAENLSEPRALQLVQAVNSYDDLLAALGRVVDLWEPSDPEQLRVHLSVPEKLELARIKAAINNATKE